MSPPPSSPDPLFEAAFDAASSGMALATPEGRWVRVNPAFCALVGYSSSELFDLGVEAIRDPEFFSAEVAQLRPLLAGAVGTLHGEEHYLLRDGRKLTAEVSTTVIRDADGRTSLLLRQVRDVGPRREPDDEQTISRASSHELQAALKRLSLHVENSPLAIVEWDHEFRVRRWSSIAVELFGWQAEEVLGLQPNEWRFVHDDDRVEVDAVVEHLLSGEPRNISVNRNYHRDGRVLHCEWYNSVLIDEDGRLDSVLSLVHDVTERHTAETRLREREAQFRTTFEQAAVGMTHVGLDGRWLRFNQKLCEITGYPSDELERLTFQDITHPDDLAGDVALVEQILSGQIDSYQLEKRYLRKDGSITWVRITVSLHRDQAGTPTYFIVPIEDINARKRAETAREALLSVLELRVSERTEELHASEHRLRMITDNLPALVAYIDSSMKYRFANDAYAQWFGTDPSSLIGKTLSERAGHYIEEFEPYLRQVLAGEAVSFEYQDSRLEVDRWLRVSWIPDQAEGGQVNGFYSMKFDITDFKRLERSLSERALSDALTGLPNRSALVQQVERARARADRGRQAIAILFIDLDGFKAVNDQLGHGAGDEVLLLVARRLTKTVRQADTVFRLGGDEFVVLPEGLSETDEHAGIVASKLIKALGEPMLVAGRSVQIGASIGVVTSVASNVSLDTLLGQADKLMYEAKSAGRNCYRSTLHRGLPQRTSQ